MATQIKTKKSIDTESSKTIYLSINETVGLIKELLDLLTIGGGLSGIRVCDEDINSYRLYLIPQKPEAELKQSKVNKKHISKKTKAKS
jgi:hypothetical protein